MKENNTKVYTPANLAAFLSSLTCAAWNRHFEGQDPTSMLDPAAGAGALLDAPLWWNGVHRQGWDLEPGAERPDIDKCDAFEQEYTADLVIMNPPYAPMRKCMDSKACKAKFGVGPGTADIASFFIRSLPKWTDKKAVVTLIATNTVAQGSCNTSTGLGSLGDEWQIAYVMPEYKWPNKDASVTCSIITLVRGYSWRIQGYVDNSQDISVISSWDELVAPVSTYLRRASCYRERSRFVSSNST